MCVIVGFCLYANITIMFLWMYSAYGYIMCIWIYYVYMGMLAVKFITKNTITS